MVRSANEILKQEFGKSPHRQMLRKEFGELGLKSRYVH
jgi:hypothetical protein